jgi:hypothetical protein
MEVKLGLANDVFVSMYMYVYKKCVCVCGYCNSFIFNFGVAISGQQCDT